MSVCVDHEASQILYDSGWNVFAGKVPTVWHQIPLDMWWWVKICENHTHMLLLEMKNPHWLIGSCLLANSFHAVFFWLKCPDFSLSLPIKYPHVVCTPGPNWLGNPQKILGPRGGCLGGCNLRQVCFCFIPKSRKILMADCRSSREDSSPLVRWFSYCAYLTMYCCLYVCCLNGIEILIFSSLV